MPQNIIDFSPIDHITTDAIGKPGQRVFYIQARSGSRVITILVEKIQIQTLAIGVEQFYAELRERYPDLDEPMPDYDEDKMAIHPPVDPLFRAAELGLAYDSDKDLMALMAVEALGDGQPEEEGRMIRLWCTRAQLRALCRWGLEVAGRGREICPYCGEPMDPEGHFCVKKNGHKH
ncbi:MAG: DUF3090 domain-containing protein [Chloroflexi bacterium]|nr:DUF3090 domain-containing protein [Chloroflexota bacterium]